VIHKLVFFKMTLAQNSPAPLLTHCCFTYPSDVKPLSEVQNQPGNFLVKNGLKIQIFSPYSLRNWSLMTCSH